MAVSALFGCTHLTSSRMLAEMEDAKDAYITKLLSFNYSKGWIAGNPAKFKAAVAQSIAHKRPPTGITAQAMGVATFDIAADLGKICMPVLVVHGDEDALIPLECGRCSQL
jgi:pimeloyl-ACP methyl ester carboxylesterase